LVGGLAAAEPPDAMKAKQIKLRGEHFLYAIKNITSFPETQRFIAGIRNEIKFQTVSTVFLRAVKPLKRFGIRKHFTVPAMNPCLYSQVPACHNAMTAKRSD